MQHQHDEAQAQASNVEAAIPLGAKREEPQSQDDCSRERPSLSLPEDIWRHIHFLMPMQGAAKAACLSHDFLSSWRCRPSLDLTNEALGLEESDKTFPDKVRHILKKHSGIGLKSLRIETPWIVTPKYKRHLNSWLRMALKPGIEDLTLKLFHQQSDYDFPCSILSNGSGRSIRYLHLSDCSFHPIPGCLTNLVSLHLCFVRITEDELACLVSSSLALETLVIRNCDEIVCLKVPHLLQRLSHVQVSSCARLEFIDITAPNISSLSIYGEETLNLSLGGTLHMKKLLIHRIGSVLYTCEKISYMVPNVEALTICSKNETVNTPTMHSRLLHLRRLSIGLWTPAPLAYDYLSLASFFDAAPSLEFFKLDVFHRDIKHVPMFTDPAELRPVRETGHDHHSLKVVKITGFYTAKSLVELVYYIVERLTSLRLLVLDVLPGGHQRCYSGRSMCVEMSSDEIKEARTALPVIKAYIEPKIPTTVKLQVVGLCSSCHVLNI